MVVAKIFLMIRYPMELGSVEESDFDYLLKTISEVSQSSQRSLSCVVLRRYHKHKYLLLVVEKATKPICLSGWGSMRQLLRMHSGIYRTLIVL